MWRLHPTVCDIISVTKLSARFTYNSVKWLLTKKLFDKCSFCDISSEAPIIYSGAKMNFLPYSPYLKTSMDKICKMMSSHNVVQHL